MWSILNGFCAALFCVMTGYVSAPATSKKECIRKGGDVRSAGCECVSDGVDMRSKCVELHHKKAAQTSAGPVLQLKISGTSPLNPVRNDHLVRLVQVKKSKVIARDAFPQIQVLKANEKGELQNGFGVRLCE